MQATINKNANEVAVVDLIAILCVTSCSFVAPIVAIFIWADKKDWAAWIQAIGSVEAIVAATLIAVGTHRMSIKAQRARQAAEHVRVLSNLKSLVEETYSYLAYVREHARAGLDKCDSAKLFPPTIGSNKNKWSDYSWKASDIRRGMSLFEKNIEQLSTVGFDSVGDPFVARKLLLFISYSRTLFDEIYAAWDLTGIEQKDQDVPQISDPLDSFKYPPGTPNLSPTQKRIGLSHSIARGYMNFYFNEDLPVLIRAVYKDLMTRLDVECDA